MANKVMVRFIDSASLTGISEYHANIFKIDGIKADYKVKKDAVKGDISALIAELEGREKTADDAEKLTKLQNKLDDLGAKQRKECAPIRKEQDTFVKRFIPQELVSAYVVAMTKGSETATGKVVVKKTVNGKVKEDIYSCTKSLSAIVKNWLKSLSVSADDKSVAKMAKYVILTGMSMKAGNLAKGEGYLKIRNSADFHELFMRAFFEYAITKTGELVATADHELVVKD